MQIPITGIVAEYNPLHRGHLYHLEKARELSKAGAIIVVMSSNFVQRGEPALLDKWHRTEAALDSGADLVLELPLVFSAHNSGVFANAAIDILGSTGIVTNLSFGLESPDLHTDRILDILIEEPEAFKSGLKEYLEKGYSFVEARSLSLDSIIPGSAQKLRGPNNILALAYMLRIKQKKWPIATTPVQRIGSDYHSKDISEYSSATAIRKSLAEGRINEALKQLPPSSAKIVMRASSEGRLCINKDKMWDILRALLLRSSPDEISRYAEIREGIEYRLREAALKATSFDEWASACTSKRYTLGRIQRHGVHFMLGLEQWRNRAFQRLGPAYIRVLGMNDTGKELLRLMRTKASLPVITRYGAASGISEYARTMMHYELLGAEIWEQMIQNGNLGCEHARKVIIKDA